MNSRVGWLPLMMSIVLLVILIFGASCGDKQDDLNGAPKPPIPTDFTFVQITDLHLDANSEHLQFLERAMNEINALAPDFVVVTGDLIDAGETLTIEEGKVRFTEASSLLDLLEMPVYPALGNHDIIGREFADVDQSDPAYGKGLFKQHFGPTYYAFDWKGTHCIVLDPNDLDGNQLCYRISEEQRQWLIEKLKREADKPLLIFFHQPTTDWEDREVLRLLQNAYAMFSGHWHYNLMMDSLGIPEQVTGALCGEWWYGPGPDGHPPGYRIIHVSNGGITSAYKGVGVDPEPYQAIEMLSISDDAVSIGRLLDNFQDFQGSLTTIEGKIGLIVKGPPFLAEGAGAFLIEDETGIIGILAETPDDVIASLNSGDRVKLVGVPLQYSLKWLTGSEHRAALELLTAVLPEKMVVTDEDGESDIRLMRWFSLAPNQ